MQKIILSQTNRVYLNTNEAVDTVKISLVSPSGLFLKDNQNNDINNKACSLDATSGKYYYDLNLDSSITPGDAYIYWVATNSGVTVILEDEFDPEDAIIMNAVSSDRYLVSPSFIMDNYLRGITEEEIAATFPGQNYRQSIRDQILAATTQLERETQVYFTVKTITNERHDWYMHQIYEKFWTICLYEYPIVAITSIKCKINEQEVIDVPSNWIQIGNKYEGRIKINPYAGGASGMAFKFLTKGTLGLALMLGEGNYVPDFFEYNYQAGIDFDNEDIGLRTELKTAIGRRVALNMLPNLDIHRGMSSESRSIDGASTTRSYTSSATFGEHSAALEQYKVAEKHWMENFKRKYLKRFHIEGW